MRERYLPIFFVVIYQGLKTGLLKLFERVREIESKKQATMVQYVEFRFCEKLFETCGQISENLTPFTIHCVTSMAANPTKICQIEKIQLCILNDPILGDP